VIFRRPPKWRTLLTLGRISNLPTVWTDCLAAWWLGGGGDWLRLGGVAAGVSSLYVGGMFLNDAFDAGFDRENRRNRPIPSGAISRKEVWVWGYGWLGLGVAVLAWTSPVILTLALCGCILLYNRLHKTVPVAPVLMGGCRLLVYLVAGSAATRGVTGEVIWKGIALGAYIVGLSCLARKESKAAQLEYWPAILLAAPVVMAGLIDDGGSAGPAAIFSVVLMGWVGWALSRSFGQDHPNIGYTVSRLLAGIALVDLLAVASTREGWIVFFGVWFVLALLLQRFIPAT
jgi:hypothetical protein